MTITDAECDEIRLRIGSVYMKTGNLSNDQIRSDTLLGAASDFVFEAVTRRVDFSKLRDYKDIDALREVTVNQFLGLNPDGTPSDTWVSPLTDRQKQQFRRAVLYRTAGLSMGLVAPVVRENLNIASRQRDVPNWQAKQSDLFGEADAAIVQLRGWFPDDAFLDDGTIFSFATVEAG